VKLLLMLALVVLGVSNQSHALPVLTLDTAVPGTYHVIAEPLYIWADPSTVCELRFAGDLLLYAAAADEWRPLTRLSSIDHNANQLLSLRLAMHIPWYGPGEYTQSFTFQLAEGNAIVIYPRQDQLWLLPLHSSEFSVTSAAGYWPLVPNQWVQFELHEPIAVYFKQMQIWPQVDEIVENGSLIVPTNSITAASTLRWPVSGFKAQVGRGFSVNLDIMTGIDETLILEFSEGLLPQHGTWSIDGQPLTLEKLQENQYRIHLPSSLSRGWYTIKGLVLASFAESAEQWIKARYGIEEAIFVGYITQTWFQEEAKVVVRVIHDGKPVAGHPVLMPNGKQAVTDSMGMLTFSVKPGLHRIISITDQQVRWFTAAPNQVCYLEIEIRDVQEQKSLVIWDIAYDSGLRWQLSMHQPHMYFTFSPDEDVQLKLTAQSWIIESFLSPEAISFQLQPLKTNSDIIKHYGPWIWKNNKNQWEGLLIDKHWVVVADLHTSQGNYSLSQLSLILADPHLHITARESQVTVSTKIADTIFGVNYQQGGSPKWFWAAANGQWRWQFGFNDFRLSGVIGRFTSVRWYCHCDTQAGTVQLGFLVNRQNHHCEFRLYHEPTNLSAQLRWQYYQQLANGQWSVCIDQLWSKQTLFSQVSVYRIFPLIPDVNMEIGWIGRYDCRKLLTSWDVGVCLNLERALYKIGWDQHNGIYAKFGVSFGEIN